MSKILNIIGKSSFEAVRSRIAFILIDELANQKVLFETELSNEQAKPSPDPELIEFYELSISVIPSKVYEQRFLDITTKEALEEPIINVIFANAPLNANVTESTQIGDDRYLIQFATASKHTTETNGDVLGGIKLQRIAAICRAILMNPNYKFLDFKIGTIVGNRVVENIQIDQPNKGGDDAAMIVMGAFTLTAKLHELVEGIAGVPLDQNDTIMRINDSDKGYVWTNGVVEPELPTLTTIAEVGGSVYPEYTEQPFLKNTKVAIGAYPDINFKFSKWLIDIGGVITEKLEKVTQITISDTTDAIAYFIRLFTLNISSIGNGSTIPETGSYEYKDGETVQIEAIPDENNQFKDFDIDGLIITENPHQLVMDSLKNVVANFSAVLQVIQEVFGTTPINQQFIDQSGNGNNVTYKNVQVAKGDGVGAYINTRIMVSNLTKVKIRFNLNLVRASSKLFGCRSGGGFFFFGVNSSLSFYGIANSDASGLSGYTAASVGYHEVIFDAKNSIVTIDGQDFVIDVDIFNIADSLYLLVENVVGSVKTDATLYSCEVWEDDVKVLDYAFQDGDDDLVINTIDGGVSGEVVGAVLSDFRGTYIDGIDSVNINNGYSRFQQIADPTKFIYAAYTAAGVPTQTSIAGYESPIEIPPNVVSNNKITYDGVLGSISGASNTYAELNALTLPEYEATKTADYISNLKTIG